MIPLSLEENILLYVLAIFAFEFIEVYWQKGQNMLSIILYNYSVLRSRGIIIYISMHISFILIVYLAIVLNNDIMWTIFIVKLIDLGYKFYLLDKISNNQIALNQNMLQMLSANIGYLKYATCIAYPLGFLFIV